MSVCYDPASGIPVPCTGWSVYDSYVTDPLYQKYFTIAWTSILALCFLTTIPSILKFARNSKVPRNWEEWSGIFGLYDDSKERKKGYRPLLETEQYQSTPSPFPSQPYRNSRPSQPHSTPLLSISALFSSLTRRPLPFTSLSTSQTFFLFLIPVVLLSTLLPESRLLENPNRFGFLALACLPPLFVLSMKNGPIGVLLGKSWFVVNFLHRWLGRAVLGLVLCHAIIWTAQWSTASEVSIFLSGSKERRGLISLSFLLLLTLSSLPPFRKFSYPLFFTLHYTSILGFLIFLNQHTIYARGWATYSIVLIYTIDIVGRIAGMRLRWVQVEALEGGMTRVEMKGLKGGWRGGMTVDVRLFFLPPLAKKGENAGKGWIRRVYGELKSAVRPFESHPFSIATAPPARSTSTLPTSDSTMALQDRGIELYVRSCGLGTWSNDLYLFAASSSSPSSTSPGPSPTVDEPTITQKQVLALISGPFPGSGLPTYETKEVFEEKENLILIAGGSGMSFVIGVLDEIVGIRVRTGRGGQVKLIWVIKEESHTSWFFPRLESIISSIPPSSHLSISIEIHVTSPSPSSSASTQSPIPLPPHTTLHALCTRPSLSQLVIDSIDKILSPCSFCYPICRCGDDPENQRDGEGVCGNSSTDCVGNIESGNTRGVLLEIEEDEELKEKRGKGELIDEITELDQLPSCCQPQVSSNRKVGCCSNEPERKKCCSYPPGATFGVREAPIPLRVRNRGGGMYVIVCGPTRMTREVRSVVAGIPISKQVRLGGVGLHVEQFSV
ncbi:hypothetical protein JCM5353_000631 [Sporobolomyces roseus]